jgi:hypothetical protein
MCPQPASDFLVPRRTEKVTTAQAKQGNTGEEVNACMSLPCRNLPQFSKLTMHEGCWTGTSRSDDRLFFGGGSCRRGNLELGVPEHWPFTGYANKSARIPEMSS